MKKVVALILTTVVLITVLCGCTVSVYDDLENFLNVEMADVIENYEKIKEEAGKWDTFEDDASLVNSLDNEMIPLVDDSLNKLKIITPQTPEVQELKDKYVMVMQTYKDGFEKMADGVREYDEAKMTAGSEKIDEALEYLKEYNDALEKLAEEVGAEVEC